MVDLDAKTVLRTVPLKPHRLGVNHKIVFPSKSVSVKRVVLKLNLA